jgi:hypothetical protein
MFELQVDVHCLTRSGSIWAENRDGWIFSLAERLLISPSRRTFIQGDNGVLS